MGEISRMAEQGSLLTASQDLDRKSSLSIKLATRAKQVLQVLDKR